MNGGASDMESEKQTRRRAPWGRLIFGMVTSVVLVAAVLGICMTPLPAGLVDKPKGDAAATRRRVDQTQLMYYCPSRMALSDKGQYGDKEFRASEGNQASAGRYAAFGSVYKATVGPLQGENASGAQTLQGNDTTEEATVKMLSTSADVSKAFDVRLLAAKSGTGAVGTTASWATRGDLTGLSAASCAAPSARQIFLTGPTTEGNTQQLLVANPSAKAASLNIRVWGSKQGESIPLSTGSTLNVKAYGEASMELSSAAPDQDGLYVEVIGKQVPVAAIIRSVKASGLTALGSDFSESLPKPAGRILIPGVKAGDAVTMIARADKTTEATFSWVNSNGVVEADRRGLKAGKVTTVNLSKAPDDAIGIEVQASSPISASALTNVSDDGGRMDFAYAVQGAAFGRSALTLPDKTEGELTMLNSSDAATRVQINGYDAQGASAGVKEYTLPAHGGVRLQAAELHESAVAFTVSCDQSVVWSARLSQHDLDDASIPGVAYVSSSALEPSNAQILVRADRSIVH
ncbi:hypothetical protein GA0061078_0198 [Bifidobacterium bohemicum]|nr:DUF5719 family protein [Bifidobacterium bohemicum]SCB72619.1 hypothetical protein GA0061078_0198 [Bifidobacterium bohemicum]